MKAVFADTGFFFALTNARDQHHGRAAELNASLEAPLVTTSLVLLEFANALAAGHARERFGRMLDRLRSGSDAEIIPPEPDLFDRGCQLYAARADKEWSLTDCISFCVMRGRDLDEALTHASTLSKPGSGRCCGSNEHPARGCGFPRVLGLVPPALSQKTAPSAPPAGPGPAAASRRHGRTRAGRRAHATTSPPPHHRFLAGTTP